MTERTDPRLDQQSREAWIQAAIERFERPLVAYARRLCGDLESARDVVQDVFLKLCDADRASVEASLREWLFTVCRHRALDERRRASRRQAVRTHPNEQGAGVDLGPSAELGPDATYEHKETVGRMLTELARLPERQREALRLKFQHGLSYQEIGRVLETSVGNVGYLIHVGLKAMRERFTNEDAAHSVEGSL